MKAALSEKEGLASLVLRLRAEGISDNRLVAAVEQTPRSMFTPPQYMDLAYSPRSIPIECGEYMEGADVSLRLRGRGWRLQHVPAARVRHGGSVALVAR